VHLGVIDPLLTQSGNKHFFLLSLPEGPPFPLDDAFDTIIFFFTCLLSVEPSDADL
jgi:hypothetical protein